MISTKDLLIEEVKVRLTEDDRQLLELLARRNGLKPAVLARSIIVRALSGVTNCGEAVQHIGRP